MATDPRFPSKTHLGIPATLATGNTARDGTGTVVEVFTAINNNAAANADVDAIIKRATLIVSSTNSVASVIRFFLNNGSTNATATNNILLFETVTPTVTESNTSAFPYYTLDFFRGFLVPKGYKILATISVSPTNPVSCYFEGEDYA